MENVYLVGASLIKPGRLYDASFSQLAGRALLDAWSEAGNPEIEALFVASSSAEVFEKQHLSGSYILGELGLRHTAPVRVEGGDASGALAIALAHHALVSGMYRCVAVVGVDKPHDMPTTYVTELQSMALDTHFERHIGATLASEAALLANMYMKRYGMGYEDIAQWPINMHEKGSKNPYAYMRRKVDLKSIIESEHVAYPLRLYDVAPHVDGAAALVLCNERIADSFVKVQSVRIAGNNAYITERDNPLFFDAVRSAGVPLLKKADGTGPLSISVHDPYSIIGLLQLESLGLADLGKAPILLREGFFDSRYLLNMSGGAKARGNPLGASSVYSTVEVAWELLGKAPYLNEHVERGVVFGIGGIDRIGVGILMTR